LLCAAFALSALAFSLLWPDAAVAHGGLSRERDTCVIRLGAYRMHFTGYETETRHSTEFCEDIPDAGKTIIVLDEFSKPMRRMAFDFRVVRDDKKLGAAAQYTQLGELKDIEASSIFYKKPEVYEQGTVTFDFQFDKGNYIGIVTLNDPETKQTFTSVFPFTVGYGSAAQIRNPIIAMMLAFGGGGAILYFTTARQKRKNKIESQNSC
jgi:hypothetical protein